MPLRAVIVEDSPLFQNVLKEILAGADPRIAVVGTGASIREAMPHLMNASADVVIADLFMPDLKGTALVELMHLSIPVILVTAAGEDDEHVRHAKALGTAAVLHKPTAPADLTRFRERLLTEIRRVCPGQSNSRC
jgi:DNA-binding NarL/FixJ family response regulator